MPNFVKILITAFIILGLVIVIVTLATKYLESEDSRSAGISNLSKFFSQVIYLQAVNHNNASAPPPYVENC